MYGYNDSDLLADTLRSMREHKCRQCRTEIGYEQYSMGITAGYWCDKCWETAPYVKDQDFDPYYAGESYDED